MPIAILTDLIAHARSNKFIEPVKRNNARLRITTSNLVRLMNKQFHDNNSDYLQSVAKALEGDVYPLDVTFTPPAITIDTRRHYGFNNTTVNYAGYASFGTCSCSFNNFIGADTYQFFYRWALLAGAITLNPNGANIDLPLPSEALPAPDLSDEGIGYKVNGTISQYYTYNPSAGDEVEYHKWILQGIFPSSVTTTGFDLATDQGSILLTSVEFSVDLALPHPGAQRAQYSSTTPVAQASRT